jgi:2-polyprenyl-6-methoxyphenol hydroxylase-like FAD-dependent oxidoreductase
MLDSDQALQALKEGNVVQSQYDALVVGARCAGAPTAMLLARRGYRVLVVDKATFPSDTISTHLVHPPGVAALRRWGLLDRLVATGCPPIDTYSFDFGPITLSGSPGTDEEPVAYGPRRTVLDKLLVDAAAEAGAEVREDFTVEGLAVEDGRVTGIRGHGKGGQTVEERARTVIGADGRHSLVAEAVGPAQYHERPPLQVSYYSYWRGLPMGGRFETWIRPGRAFAAWPTHDDLTVVIAGVPFAEFEANRRDVEGNFHRTLALVPSFAARVGAATRAERFAGAAVPGYFRTPYGPGWALVGDAGYNKDFITAQGIQDAFLDAELCTAALHQAYAGERPYEAAMRGYQETRDGRALPMYELTCQFATLEPPSPEMQQLLGAVSGNQEAMDDFARVVAGVTSAAEFFSSENVERLVAMAR